MPKIKTGEQMRNTLEKGFPARESLNEKIGREAKAVFDSASEDDLTSFHSEVEVKTQLRDALCDTSMTDEMVQALYIKGNVLEDAYRFYTEESKDSQVFLAVFEYLEKAEHDYLADRVFDRVKLEYEEFIEMVKGKTPGEIIEDAYKITILHDIHISLDPAASNYSTGRLKALMSLDSPLWNLYNEWQRSDRTLMGDIKDVINETADERAYELDEKGFIDEDELECGNELYELEYEDEQDI